METDVAMLDDPPGKDESSSKATDKDDAEPLSDNKLPLKKETFEQLPYGQCSYQSGQEEAFSEEVVTDDCHTGGKASKKSPWKMQQGAILSGKILSFCCSECKTNTTYSPNDLLKHFQECHKGTLPTYPCDLCSFVTNQFSSFQCHRTGVHRAPQVTCEICNDGVQYSLLLLTRHYILSHSQNGHFNCEKCEFSTRDAGTFVQHIHHHNEGRHASVECQYVSPSKREIQRPVLSHSATFPFTCHFCGYGAARKDYLTKHMAMAHCEEKARWKTEEKPCVTSPTGLKLLLKKGPVAGGSREPQWMSKLNNLPGAGLLDQNGRFYNPEKALEETQQFLERAVRVKKENSLRMNCTVKTEPQCSYPSSPATPQPKPPETDPSPGSAPLNPNNNNNGLTVLMVKNKISIPPNCTTKVMGFKIVDGKKHLVLKVIPAKQESCGSPSEGSTTVKEVDSTKYAEFSDDGDKLHSPCSVMSSPLALHNSDAVESCTTGTLNDLAKAMNVLDTDNDIIDVLPMEIEKLGEAEQSGKCDNVNCTLKQENHSPTSQCEIPVSLLTKESKTTMELSNGETHAEKRSSCDSPSESTTAEVSLLDKSLDCSKNTSPIAHSKHILLDSTSEGNTSFKVLRDSSATPHSIPKATTLPDTVSQSSEEITMTSHLTKNDPSPSKSIEVSAMESAQSSLASNTPAERVPCSSSAADEFTYPNRDLIPTDATVHEGMPPDSPQVKVATLDLAEVKDTQSPFEEEIATNLKEVCQIPSESPCNASCSDLVRSSTLSESHEDMEVVNLLESNPRPSETIDGISKSQNSTQNNGPDSDSAEIRGAPLKSSEPATSCSNEKIMLSESSVDSKDATPSLNVVSNLSSHPNEVKATNSNCRISQTHTADKTKPSDVPDLISPVTTPLKTMSSFRITTVSNKSKSVPVNANTVDATVTDIESTAQMSKSANTLPSIVEKLRKAALNAAAIKPSSRVDTGVVSKFTKYGIDGVNSSPLIDTEPVALQTVHNRPTHTPPTDNANCMEEKPTSPKLSPTSKSHQSDCKISGPAAITKDSSEAETCKHVDKLNPLSSGGPIKSRDFSTLKTPRDFSLSRHPEILASQDTQAESPESSCHDHSKKLSSIASKKHHSANTRVILLPLKSPSTQHTPSTDDSILSVQSKPVPPGAAETDTVLIDSDCEELNSALSSPTQEVFSFHNYSKETVSSFSDTVLSSEQNALQAHDIEEVDDEEDCGDFSADWRLTLDASPTPPQATCCEEEESEKNKNEVQSLDENDLPNTSATSLERVSDSDIEVDECVAPMDETCPAVEKQTGVQRVPSAPCKAPEDDTFVSHKGPGVNNNVAVLGRILEKHSDAIINHQLVKERLVTPIAPANPVSYNSVKRTKTTLKILQTSEGKQQMFLQTPDNQYTPVKLANAPGFKLITKSSSSSSSSSSSKINVSYVQPGIERPNKTTGLTLTVGTPGGGLQASSAGGKGPMPVSSLQLGTTSSGGRYLLNAASLNSPIFLSGAVKSPTGDQTATRPQTCYLLQRPLPAVPGTSRHDPGSHMQQTSRPVLAMPVQQMEKTSPLQTGRQAYLVRYLSPAKSGVLLGNREGKAAGSNTLSSEGGKSRVFLKIVRSANGTRFLSGVPASLGKKPIYLATGGGLQSPCFVMSSNNSVGYVSAGLKASNVQHGLSQPPATLSQFSNTQLPQLFVQEDGVISHKKSHHVSNETRRKRKKHRKTLFDDMSESSSKARRLSGRTEREEPKEWAPAPKDVERTLRLSPFSAFQHIKYPRQNQPVVVLNHPDADIPEVVSIMKSVNKFKGEVLKVALSQRTVQALSELGLPPGNLGLRPDAAKSSTPHGSARARIVGGNVRERFILKLKLKKTSRNKYEVVRKPMSGGSAEQVPTFSCWFCGRIFNNQEDWIGHGQRHLMEATRDWNKLF